MTSNHLPVCQACLWKETDSLRDFKYYRPIVRIHKTIRAMGTGLPETIKRRSSTERSKASFGDWILRRVRAPPHWRRLCLFLSASSPPALHLPLRFCFRIVSDSELASRALCNCLPSHRLECHLPTSLALGIFHLQILMKNLIWAHGAFKPTEVLTADQVTCQTMAALGSGALLDPINWG